MSAKTSHFDLLDNYSDNLDACSSELLVAELLKRINPSVCVEKGMAETPERIVKSWKELFSGYSVKIESLFKVFDSPVDSMVVLSDIEFYSTCEHHMLPFVGKAHIGYVPTEKVIGVSKLARLLDAFARRFQIQERIGQQVVEALVKHLNAKGAICVIEAKHLCMCARGVGKQHSVMKTSALKGVFEKPEVRAEFMALIRGGPNG